MAMRRRSHDAPTATRLNGDGSQVSGPVIAVGLVLSPCSFPVPSSPASRDSFFRQFALTIAVSTVISAFNSLTLSPALTALLLKPREHGRAAPPLPGCVSSHWRIAGLRASHTTHCSFYFDGRSGVAAAAAAVAAGVIAGWVLSNSLNALLAVVFRKFNVGFNHFTNGYVGTVGMLLRVSAVVLLVYGGLLALTGMELCSDAQGVHSLAGQGLSAGQPATAGFVGGGAHGRRGNRNGEVGAQDGRASTTRFPSPDNRCCSTPTPRTSARCTSCSSRSRNGWTQNFLPRPSPGDCNNYCRRRCPTDWSTSSALPHRRSGNGGRFQDRRRGPGRLGVEDLQKVADGIVHQGNNTEGLRELFTSFRADTPGLFLDIDRSQAKARGVQISEIFNTLQVNLGSLYINDFNRFGRTWQVIAQADIGYRKKIEDLHQLKVKSDRGGMVPLMSLVHVNDAPIPVLVMRYNLYPSVAINGTPARASAPDRPSTGCTRWRRSRPATRCSRNGRSWRCCSSRRATRP